jgi:sigma-B regulation protein RsbU (phosphoserine phosphatase)
VLAVPGRPAGLVEMPIDPPLGVGGEDWSRRTTTVPLPPGALLLAYTDGLVERRGQVIDTGLARLTALVTADDPDVVCTTAMTAMGIEQPTDDVALLAVRRLP